MRLAAQLGTFALLAALAGCSRVTTSDPDAGAPPPSAADQGGSGPRRDAGPPPRDAGKDGNTATLDAGVACRPPPCPRGATWDQAKCLCAASDAGPPAPECLVDSDCSMIARGCCAACGPASAMNSFAVPSAKRVEAANAECPGGPPACGPCPPQDPDPLAPVLRAGCVAQRCELVDLRSTESSRCTADSECRAAGLGCCGPYSDEPREYVGLREGADASILICSPLPPCTPPMAHGDPRVFCAADGHCAVRRSERSAGLPSDSCYSPTQNLERAYDSGAQGCDCAPGSPPLCRSDANGRQVALICGASGRWSAAEDGPCSP
jgi:hypothetical protein